MDTIVPWHLALAVVSCSILRKVLQLPAFSACATWILGVEYYLDYRDGYEPLQSFISDLITNVLLLALGYYLLSSYLSSREPFKTVSQSQRPGSPIVTSEQDNSQAIDAVDHSKLATIDNAPSGSGKALVFRCPSDSEGESEDDMEISRHLDTLAQYQACSRIFKEMRAEDESLKASNAELKMKQWRMEKQAKTWESKVARANQKAKETEIRLREAVNGTELAKLQSLYAKASAELKLTYKQVDDLRTEADIDKALIRKLTSEAKRANLDKAELDRKLTLEADAEILKKIEVVRSENERALRKRDEEVEKQRTQLDASNKELERLRQEVQNLKSTAVTEKQKLDELESTRKRQKEEAEEYKSQLKSKETDKVNLSRRLDETAKELKEANEQVTSLRSQLQRKEDEEANVSKQLEKQDKELDAAKREAESLQFQLNEKNDKDEQMEDVAAPHECDHSECKRLLDGEKQVSQKLRERVQVLEPQVERLRMPYREAQATLLRQSKETEQDRDAAYKNVAALKAEKGKLEEELRRSDAQVEEGRKEG